MTNEATAADPAADPAVRGDVSDAGDVEPDGGIADASDGAVDADDTVAVSDGDGVAGTNGSTPESPPDPAGPFAGHWSRVAGLILLAYLVVSMARLALLRADAGVFRTVTGAMGSFGYRFFVWVVLIALLWHGFSGLRVVVLESSARARRRAEWLTAAALFGTVALAIPGALLIFRPWIEGTLL